MSKRIIPGVNDLAAKNPELAAQWDYDRNDGLTPQMITAGTARQVWWRCPRGHSWKACVRDRGRGDGCSICAGKQVLIGFNDLASQKPQIAAQWDYDRNEGLTPQMVTVGSHRQVWWRCELGHSWKASVNARRGGTGCPVCIGRQVLIGFNDLASQKPELAAQWDYDRNDGLTPQMVTLGSNRHVWWQCSLGHSWRAMVNVRNNGCGCPVCAGKQVLADFNDLASQNPQIAAQWDYDRNDGFTPQMVTSGSQRQIWWRCSLGHSWKAAAYARCINGVGCPVCAGKQVLTGFNDLASQNPKIAAQWDYDRNDNLTPQMVTSGSQRKIWWKCSLGHSWKAAVHTRCDGVGCPVCSGKKALAGFNDLASQNPELAAQWDYDRNGNLTPQMVTSGSQRQVWWRCSLDHSWKASIKNRRNGTGCPVCANLQVLSGFNDLASQNPELAAQWDYEKNDGLTPQMVTPGVNRKVWWRCDLGHSWMTAICNRNAGNGCPVCAGQQVLIGFNDLASQNPELAAQWDYDRNDGLTPQMVTLGTEREVWWRCDLGHSWKAKVTKRNIGRGCPVCLGLRHYRRRLVP